MTESDRKAAIVWSAVLMVACLAGGSIGAAASGWDAWGEPPALRIAIHCRALLWAILGCQGAILAAVLLAVVGRRGQPPRPGEKNDAKSQTAY